MKSPSKNPLTLRDIAHKVKDVANKVEGKTDKSFDTDEARHQLSTERLKIAKKVICIVSGLVIACMVLLWFLPIDQKRELLSTMINSLFSILTLTIGFVAGSSIDNNK